MPAVPSTVAQDFWEWIAEQGYSGSPNEQTKAYLAAEGFTGPMNTALYNWLASLGYTGTLNMMLNQFERDYTIQDG